MLAFAFFWVEVREVEIKYLAYAFRTHGGAFLCRCVPSCPSAWRKQTQQQKKKRIFEEIRKNARMEKRENAAKPPHPAKDNAAVSGF